MDPPVDVAREDTDSDVTSGFEGTTLVGDSTEGYDSDDFSPQTYDTNNDSRTQRSAELNNEHDEKVEKVKEVIAEMIRTQNFTEDVQAGRQQARRLNEEIKYLRGSNIVENKDLNSTKNASTQAAQSRQDTGFASSSSATAGSTSVQPQLDLAVLRNAGLSGSIELMSIRAEWTLTQPLWTERKWIPIPPTREGPWALTHRGLDYNQIGVEFLWAMEARHEPTKMVPLTPGIMSGHATAPTAPLNQGLGQPGETPPHPMSDLANDPLMCLFYLSPIEEGGTMTPIQALQYIRSLPEFYEYTLSEFEAIKDDLKTKVRFLHFGAALEWYDLENAINALRSSRINRSSGFLS